MQLNWLKARRNLIAKIIFDFLLLIILNINYFYFSVPFNFGNFLLYLIILICVGYVVGKYHKYPSENKLNILYYGKSAIIEYFVSSSIISILLLIEGENIGFKNIGLILLFITISNLFNFIYGSFLKNKSKNKNQKWLFVGNKNQFEESLNIAYFHNEKYFVDFTENNSFHYKNYLNYRGVIFLNFDDADILLKNYQYSKKIEQ